MHLDADSSCFARKEASKRVQLTLADDPKPPPKIYGLKEQSPHPADK